MPLTNTFMRARTRASSEVMPFGRHAGHPLSSLPLNYVLWAIAQDWMRNKYPDLAFALFTILQQRIDDGTAAKELGIPGTHSWQDLV